MEIELSRKTLHFKKPARTSRGEYNEHEMLVVTLHDDDGRVGVGECAPLPDLSCDRWAYRDMDKVHELLQYAVSGDYGKLKDYPALLFAFESALADCHRDPRLYDTPYARGEVGIPINGLVWMADFDDMLAQVKQKLAVGCRCVKLKIGAIEWEREMELIRYIRSHYSASELQLRVDANGAFSPDEAMSRLEELSRYAIHSIEQPVMAAWQVPERNGGSPAYGSTEWTAIAGLCRETPIPIALDEELIGINDDAMRSLLLDTIRPQYIVLKPTLHGGMTGTMRWIDEARQRNIGSWITSALESNIGLRSVSLLAAYAYGDDISFPQGLGTGQLFTDNVNEGEMVLREGSRMYVAL